MDVTSVRGTIERGWTEMSTAGLPELVALNDEIAALVRARLPLETGLGLLGREWPGRLGRIGRELGARMERGESLPVALSSLKPEVPRAYRAVVEAGLRSGRLAEALEGVAEQARRRLDLRRTIERAMGYPLLVLSLAYALGLASLAALVPRLREAATALDVTALPALDVLETFTDAMPYWAAIPPIAVVLVVVLWRWGGRRGGLGGFDPLEFVPHVGSILRRGHRAGFADWLGLLLEHGVDLPEALELAGGACGDGALDRAARAAAGRVSAGRSLDEAAKALPAWLGHALLVGDVSGDLPAALREAARHDRRRAEHRAELLREWLPGVMLQTIGGLSVLIYAAVLFLPWGRLLEGLARPAP
jgi:general secretion pathway protein F